MATYDDRLDRPPPPTEVLGRRFAGAIKPPLLDAIQWGSLRMTYRGIAMLKNPFDLALYTLLIGRLRPRTLIEIGTASGGSALWFADTMYAHGIEAPRIISIDIEPKSEVADERIEFLEGDARSLASVLAPQSVATMARPMLAVDDGSHLMEDIVPALEYLHEHLRPGDYVVVEDGNLSEFSHPAYRVLDSGPNRAVAAFLAAHPDDYSTARRTRLHIVKR